jgi:hypothetical protein
MRGAANYIRVNAQFDQTFSMDYCGAIPGMLAATERFTLMVRDPSRHAAGSSNLR